MRTGRLTNTDSPVDEGHLYLREANWDKFSQWFQDCSDQFWWFNQKEFLEDLVCQNVFNGILHMKASKLFNCIFPAVSPMSWCEAVRSFIEEIKKRAIYDQSTLDFAVYLYDKGMNDLGVELAKAFVADDKFKERADDYLKFIREHPSENADLLLLMFADRQGTSTLYINDFISRPDELEGGSEEDLTEPFESGPEPGSSRLV